MALRICLVTPFAWSQPHPVNEHVAGAADALRALGHNVTVLAPSTRARDLAAGRRTLRRLARGDRRLDDFVALGPALPLAPRNRIGVPVGVRANLGLVLTRGAFDVVHGHEPGLASLSYLALRDTGTIAVATFHDPERLGYPPGKAQRARLLGRIDALTATSPVTAAAAAARYPGEYRLLPAGVDTKLFAPATEQRRFVLEWDPDARPVARTAIRALRALPGWELAVLRPSGLAGRPYVPRDLRDRVSVHVVGPAGVRSALLGGAAGMVAGADESSRLRLEAAATGTPLIAPPARLAQPELVAAEMQRLAGDAEYRRAQSKAARATAETESFAELGKALDELYRSLLRRRRAPEASDPLEDRPWILADLHMHTEHSHDCSIPVADLLDHAERIGLGAIAVTDHNVFSGALEAVELARGTRLRVIPGEEVKTDGQGEVIGLFLEQEVPRGRPMGETIAAIREQGGLVYLPHPFDRLHAIPDAATLHRHLAEIDVLEVFNARLLRDSFNDEAARFARKYNLLAGAGSDAHVLQGVGTGLVRMRAFETPEEFLLSLRSAEILRRPKSLLYLQGLKWMAQARERRVRASAQ
jgi:predicted metal-dependent phosphoesterase TrpH/glycosyltransferase involved in cell wall biosynthesis